VQIVTGLFLTMFYTPHTDFAFGSSDHIMRDIDYGWLIRYIHANGASLFFLFVYIHMLRGVYFGSYQYPRTGVWMTGVTIYLLLMGTASLGYVLPWGQMSFWAATVITNFITVVPLVGDELVYRV
jgi:ubiquinol-cytochrome c reductase cytochrome b/c1 subunit